MLDFRVFLPETSKKLNPIHQGPYRLLKMNSSHTKEIRSYDGSGDSFQSSETTLESMIWGDGEWVDFNDLRSSQPLDDPATVQPSLGDDAGNSIVPHPPNEFVRLPKPKLTVNKNVKLPSVVTKPTIPRRIGLRPWSVLNRTSP